MKKHSETALKVLELKAMGGSVHSISKTLSISERQTRKSLDLIYNEIRDGLLSNFISENLPGQIAEHLEPNRIIIRRCMVISSARYRLQRYRLRRLDWLTRWPSLQGEYIAMQISSELQFVRA